MPSALQRVCLPPASFLPHRSSPEETPPDFFYFANPKKLAYVFQLLSSSLSIGAGIRKNPVAGTSALCVRVEKADGRPRLGLGEETTFYEHTAIANNRRESTRTELKHEMAPGIRTRRYSAEPRSRRNQNSPLRLPRRTSSSLQPV